MNLNFEYKQLHQLTNYYKGPLLFDISAADVIVAEIVKERFKNLLKINNNNKFTVLSSSLVAVELLKKTIEKDSECKHLMKLQTFYPCTFTEYCWDIAKKQYYTVGVPQDLALCDGEQDRLTVLHAAILSDQRLADWLKECKDKRTVLYELIQSISQCKNDCIDPEDCGCSDNISKFELFPRIYHAYQTQLKVRHMLDADDAVNITRIVMSDFPVVRKSCNNIHRFFFVLEAQDLTRLQYQFLKAVASGDNKNLMLVGDSKRHTFGRDIGRHDFMTQDFVADFSPTQFHLKQSDIVISDTDEPVAAQLPNVIENGCLSFN